jgi:hypothetical protein
VADAPSAAINAVGSGTGEEAVTCACAISISAVTFAALRGARSCELQTSAIL